ncbi:Daunorubicin/doxorubicin resistance ATP-binding protein DrrA [Acaryochloris thomasi RCC1774]|uniref:Daunorubicin/doxorubicin resistance ATP-binding protein DrrA n=1 Tax=Acaryochloris thomasi RCC1774 TaxID=1764569 RepID=A0A2W1JZ47_9CYAN|nr:ABC transporter ATP-binding protein [Acaryochloris thomasi]PZD74724.1 Daunorubicin/doxorubicin resistance ATP-binding protein DrrA [Acaryochloris thomasi RCC1774]
MTVAVELINLSKRFGEAKAVDRLHLQIPRGCFYALLGSNGAGKTTTLRMMAGLLKPDQGDALILGNSITQRPEAAKQPLAYVPDDPMLYDKLRPMEYLEFVAGLWQIPPDQAAAQALLEEFEMWDRRGEFIETFPQGMKQRLALAGAFIHSPQVMLLDEPLTGIDPPMARLIKDKLKAYVSQGNTVVMTTHIMTLAEQLAQRIGIFHAGRLLADGTLAELQAQTGEETLEDIFIQVTRPQPVSGV